MNYEEAATRYARVRNEITELDRKYKADKASLKEKLVLLENWFTMRAQEDGLESIKTSLGTAYWSSHQSATVASREDFFAFCKENDAWELVESRASKTAVRDHLETHGELPPGINYNTIKVFNFRQNQNRG
jgi:hypothetical protein